MSRESCNLEMSGSKLKTRSHIMEYTLQEIGLSDNTSTYMVEDLVIKRADIIKGITKDEWTKIKDESGSLIKAGYWKLQAKFKMWCTKYRQTNQGRLPT